MADFVKYGKRNVGGKDVITLVYKTKFCEVEVGATGECGGDTGHGGRVYIRVEDNYGLDCSIKQIVSESNQNNCKGLELCMGGDWEFQEAKDICNLIGGLLLYQRWEKQPKRAYQYKDDDEYWRLIEGKKHG